MMSARGFLRAAFPSLPFSIRESFGQTGNPLAARLSGFCPPGLRRRFPSRLRYLAFMPPLLMMAWVVGLLAGWQVFLSKVGELTYLVWILTAFGAPALGAAIRRSFDTDPVLPELLASPMSEKDYLAALHGPVLILSMVAFAMAFLPGAGLLAALYHEPAMKPPPYTLHLLFKLMGFGGYPEVGSLSRLVLASAFLVTASLNFACGVYLHASILARICQIDPKTKAKGGFMTAGIVASLPVLMLVAVMMPTDAFGELFGEEFRILGAIAGSLFLLIPRWLAAVRLWKATQRKVMSETTRQLGFESSWLK